jgi:hypothetical protein
MPCFAIATIDEIVAALIGAGPARLDDELLGRIREYRARYGGK